MAADFELDLRWSQQEHFQRQEMALLQRIFRGAVVRKTSIEIDKLGGDYSVERGDKVIYIDVKRRRAGAARYWRNNEPQVPVEVPTSDSSGDLFKGDSVCNYRLFLFEPCDYSAALLVPFDELRTVASANLEDWQRRFKTAEQVSSYHGRLYNGVILFVPVRELIRAGVRVWKYPLQIKNSPPPLLTVGNF